MPVWLVGLQQARKIAHLPPNRRDRSAYLWLIFGMMMQFSAFANVLPSTSKVEANMQAYLRHPTGQVVCLEASPATLVD